MLFRYGIRSELPKLLFRKPFQGVRLVRGYAQQDGCSREPGPGETPECKTDHPKEWTRAEVEANFPFYNLIKFSDDCCGMKCPDKGFPSFDECLYKESDKNARKYQITWTECPQVAIQPKKICCFDKATPPPIERRPPKWKPDTACKFEKECLTDTTCRKIKLPGCRPVRDPPKCENVRAPAFCQKIKTPYPSFSECSRPKLKKPKRTECTCWDEIPVCILLQALQKRERDGKMSFSPCG